MRDFSKTLLAVGLLGATATAAVAQPAPKAAAPAAAVSPLVADVRCMLTMVALGSNKERQQAAQVGADFFAGRISARFPAPAMADAIRSQAPVMQNADFQAEFKRCAPIVATYTGALQQTLVSLRPAGAPPAAAGAAPPITPTPGAPK